MIAPLAWVCLAVAAVALIAAGVLEVIMISARLDRLDKRSGEMWRQIDALSARQPVRRDPRAAERLPRLPRRERPKG